MALSTYCTTTCVDIDLMFGMTFLPQWKLAKRKKNLSSLWGWFLGRIDDSHLDLFIFFCNSPCTGLSVSACHLYWQRGRHFQKPWRPRSPFYQQLTSPLIRAFVVFGTSCACVRNTETLILGVCILSVHDCVNYAYYSCSDAYNHPVREWQLRRLAFLFFFFFLFGFFWPHSILQPQWDARLRNWQIWN